MIAIRDNILKTWYDSKRRMHPCILGIIIFTVYNSFFIFQNSPHNGKIGNAFTLISYCEKCLFIIYSVFFLGNFVILTVFIS